MNSNALLLLLLQALVWSSYMFSVPLLPPYASRLNLTKDLIGFLLSSYTLTFILSTIFLAKYLVFLNKFRILYISLISLGISIILSGIMLSITHPYLFLLVQTLLRLIQGLACGCYSVIIYSLVPSLYPSKLEEILSYMETISGLATSLSPILSMFLYHLFGGELALIVFGAFYLAICSVIIKKITLEGEELKKEEEEEDEIFEISVWDLVRNREYCCTLVLYTVNSVGLFLLYPLLGDQLMLMTGSLDQLGISFALLSLLYTVVALLLGQLFTKYALNKRLLLLNSSILLFLAYYMLANTSTLFTFQLSLLIIGAAEAFVSIPFIPEAMEIGFSIFPGQIAPVTDMASAFWNLGMGVAEFVGPLMGGILSEYIGWTGCMWTYSWMVAFIGLVYLFTMKIIRKMSPLEEGLVREYERKGVRMVRSSARIRGKGWKSGFSMTPMMRTL